MNEQLRMAITEGTPLDVVERYESLPAVAAESDFGEFDSNVVVLDTETTGFSLHHDELTQIAAARVENGEIADWYVTFVNPGKPIPDDVAHLTDIHDSDVADAPTPQEALAGLVAFVGDAKIVAHNAEFDRNFTTKHPEGYSLLENTWLDSLELSRIALPRMKSHRLIDLVTAFGAPRSTHRADDDVAATCALFRILLAGVSVMPPTLVREIARMSTPEVWPTSVVFDYFAARNQAEADRAVGTGDGAHVAAFSLVSMRRDRTKTLNLKAKSDARPTGQNAPEQVFPDAETILEAFTPDGIVGSLYPDFEVRTEQQTMAEAVQNAFTNARNLMVEAGTGVGKSMAYLLPSAMTALDNNITVGVATKTNALLDQLMYHELPELTQALDRAGYGAAPLTYAALKGFAHYPCLFKIRRLVQDGPGMRPVNGVDKPQAPQLAALLSFVEQTEYGDIDSLKIDYRVMPRRFITTTSAECLRRKCPFFGVDCFVHGSRRLAESANIVVTNHTLLFCDIAAEGGLLPPIRYWVVDEAHGAETEARRALSVGLETEAIQRIVRRLTPQEQLRSIFARAERVAVVPGGEQGSTLFFALTNKATAASSTFRDAAAEFQKSLRGLLFFDSHKGNKGYETVELWINDDIRSSATFADVAAKATVMSSCAEKVITACQEIVAYLEDVEGAAAVQREIAAIAMELKEMTQAAEIIFALPNDGYVYSATLSRKGDRPIDRIEAMLYNVGSYLDETLYQQTNSVVFTSATLTVSGSFDAATRALGLNESPESACDELMLPSSYDYDSAMTVYVANDLPEPNDPAYLKALEDLLLRAHVAQDGAMLTLFTNRKEMEKSFDAVQQPLKEHDLRLVCQKWGVSVKGLRDDFLADEHLSLFALKSFWEGFDAPGATLKGVIIPKLPFAKPTDPLSCERASRDDNAWRNYVLPAAVMETKQAAGRLIRKADDRGVLILADRRLVSKSYGKTFLSSLPSQTIRICSVDDIIADLEARNR